MDEGLFDGCLGIDPTLPQEELHSCLVKLPACKGVILFADGQREPIQLLIAADIRRTARARLCSGNTEETSRRPDILTICGHIFYCRSYNDFKAALTYYRIAKKLWPGDYEDIVSLGKNVFVKIDTAAKWPCFNITSSVSKSQTEKIFGPFESRKSAAEFIKILEDVFCLCQRHELIDNPSKAASCPYLQMEKCPGPCVGNITRDEYLELVSQAVKAAEGKQKQIQARLSEQMAALAGNMEFERASLIKHQIDKLDKLNKSSYEWTREISELKILHIDLSAKIAVKGKRKKVQSFSAFLYKNGEILEFGPFFEENSAEFYELISAESAPDHVTVDNKTQQEHLSLISSFLYRANRPGIWSADLKKEMFEKPALSKLVNKKTGNSNSQSVQAKNMKKEILVATTNPGKMAELSAMLQADVKWLSLADFPDIPEVVEDGTTFAENARKKALGYAAKTGHWTIADDSGLVIDALDGAPGIHSARFSGPKLPGEERGLIDHRNIQKVLKLMENTPSEERTARFVCALCLASPEEVLLETTGTCEGKILQEETGSNGFGYDPVFFSKELGKSLGVAESEEKNRISHRANAIRKLKAQLAELI